jgi:hypothetical protein
MIQQDVIMNSSINIIRICDMYFPVTTDNTFQDVPNFGISSEAKYPNRCAWIEWWSDLRVGVYTSCCHVEGWHTSCCHGYKYVIATRYWYYWNYNVCKIKCCHSKPLLCVVFIQNLLAPSRPTLGMRCSVKLWPTPGYTASKSMLYCLSSQSEALFTILFTLSF